MGKRTRPDSKKGAAERDEAALKQYKRILLLRGNSKLALDEGIQELRNEALKSTTIPEISQAVYDKAMEMEKIRRKELRKLKITEVQATRSDIRKRSRDRTVGTIEKFEQIMELCDAYVLTEKGHKTPRKSQGTPSKASPATRRHEKTKDDTDSDDEPLVRSSSMVTRMHKTPPYLAGTLRQYQVDGVNWMLDLHQNCLSGILADEMGLGKTFQTIALLSFLKYSLKLPGPHLVICPRSILGNWNREFARWSPGMRPFVFHGSKPERRALRKRLVNNLNADVVLTTWEQVTLELSAFKKINFEYLILDEGHKIKNDESTIATNVRKLKCVSRLLITGTPLQNNLKELWALLNFLMPSIFRDNDDFEGWFDTAAGTSESKVMDRLHKMLKPFMLRRIKTEADAEIPPKKEVYVACKLSKMQRTWYQTILARDTELVNDDDGVRASTTSALKNIMMQLRKCCNHPFLFEGTEEPPFITDESIVKNSGKMIILDKLLAKLLSEPKETRQKILIFSQMTRVLDILSDYLEYRNYRYCRLDGGTPGEQRDLQMNDFNSPNTDKQIFILSTRAGGLGINLQSASVVILFDSDWNPQQDLQAMDRAHRIGQKRPVTVYRFITEGTMEERMYQRAMKKLYLDAIVVQQGNLQNRKANDNLSSEEVKGMIRWGAAAIFKNNDEDIENVDIDKIIEMGAKFQSQVEKDLEKSQQKSLQNFNLGIDEGNMYEFEGVDYTDRPTKTIYIRTDGLVPIDPVLEQSLKKYGKVIRFLISPERNKAVVTYKTLDEAVNAMSGAQNQILEGCSGKLALNYGSKATIVTEVMKMDIERHLAEVEEQKRKEAIAQRTTTEQTEEYSAQKGKGPTLPKLEKMHPWQFFDVERIEDLHEMKVQKLIARHHKDPTADEKFTEEDEKELEKLKSEGFPDWNHRMMMKMVDISSKLGRDCSDEVAEALHKPKEEVARYIAAFWEQGPHTLERFELFKKRITAGEVAAARTRDIRSALKKKFDATKGHNPYSPTATLGKLSKVLPNNIVERYALCYSYATNNNWQAVANKIRCTPELFFDLTAQTKTSARFAGVKKLQSDAHAIEKNKKAPPPSIDTIKRQKNEPEESKAKKRMPKK
eukprot:TRINITY_DN15002_c0_g1_i1.p1 TRINITY_DN15002_c0_g1~~TRINITY_DN15002_c0_g1_i1.p1  ORF type:complete len:1113 (+),score=244.13 TRINITY_DN15002_c0_g1_i1:70-3408(+)